MGYEPNVVVAHVLIDIDQDQYSGKEDAQENVSPLRDAVRREELREHQQIDQQHDARDEQREKQEIEIHGGMIVLNRPGVNRYFLLYLLLF